MFIKSNIFFMIRSFLFSIFIILGVHTSYAQGLGDYGLGGGLKIASRDYNYGFQLGGAIQPKISFLENSERVNTRFSPELTFLRIQGFAIKEKLAFFIQSDYSRNDLLMDAWISYAPVERIKLTIGQMPNIGNNREMLFYEDQLSFTSRSLFSSQFCQTGREIGVRLEGEFNFGKAKVYPKIAITTGDGRNSFGDDSRDVDIGGYKYAFRLDLSPFGDFSEGNTNFSADLVFEKKLKILIGVSGSYNFGASGPVGESHGDFTMYRNVSLDLPDYRKWYLDALLKYRGVSLLFEMGQATATSLIGLKHSVVPSDILLPEEISGYLSLGTGGNFLAEIMIRKDFSLAGNHSIVYPEFDYSGGLFVATSLTNLGFNYYHRGHNAKLHLDYGIYRDTDGLLENQVQVIFQVRI
tara:strand:+ start:12048 stop:13274 length:1227 start_codon:yes stop_codon:yes gene_type:complete